MIDTKKLQEVAEPMLEKTKAGIKLRRLEKKMRDALTEEEQVEYIKLKRICSGK